MRAFVTLYDLILMMLILMLALAIFIELRPSQSFEVAIAQLQAYEVYDSLVYQIFYRPMDYVISTNYADVNLKDSGLTFPVVAAWICYNISEIKIHGLNYTENISLFAKNYFARKFIKQLYEEYQPFVSYLAVEIACKRSARPTEIAYGKKTTSSICVGETFNTSYNLTLTVIVCR